jgi:hypothetical protein
MASAIPACKPKQIQSINNWVTIIQIKGQNHFDSALFGKKYLSKRVSEVLAFVRWLPLLSGISHLILMY